MNYSSNLSDQDIRRIEETQLEELKKDNKVEGSMEFPEVTLIQQNWLILNSQTKSKGPLCGRETFLYFNGSSGLQEETILSIDESESSIQVLLLEKQNIGHQATNEQVDQNAHLPSYFVNKLNTSPNLNSDNSIIISSIKQHRSCSNMGLQLQIRPPINSSMQDSLASSLDQQESFEETSQSRLFPEYLQEDPYQGVDLFQEQEEYIRRRNFRVNNILSGSLLDQETRIRLDQEETHPADYIPLVKEKLIYRQLEEDIGFEESDSEED